MRVEEQLFSKIMVPVDLAHLDHLVRPLEVAADWPGITARPSAMWA